MLRSLRFLLAVAALAMGTTVLAADQVAVVAFSSDPLFKKFERAVLARMEAVLTDAGITVLDEEKAKKLRTGWVDLADPSHLVTAEEFLQKAGQYDVQRVYSISFNAGVSSPLALFFTATSAVQIRVIDKDAKVHPASSQPMGTKGFPASDALTSDAALVNALQRSVDSAAEAVGLSVSIPTIARSVPLGLEAAPTPVAPVPLSVRIPASSDAWIKGASLYNESWKKEEVGCSAISDDGQMGVVGGYAWELQRRGGVRTYGARLHLIDVANTKELLVFTMHELGQRGAGENGTSEPLACVFLGHWRYLIGMTGNKIACFDVERGLETCSINIADAPSKAKLSFWQDGALRYLRVDTDKGASYYRIVVKK